MIACGCFSIISSTIPLRLVCTYLCYPPITLPSQVLLVRPLASATPLKRLVMMMLLAMLGLQGKQLERRKLSLIAQIASAQASTPSASSAPNDNSSEKVNVENDEVGEDEGDDRKSVV